MGDLNINILNHDHNNDAKLLVETFKEFLYFPTITKPTRVYNMSATLLDHIWINFGHTDTQKSNIVFTGITDHFRSYITINYALPSLNSRILHFDCRANSAIQTLKGNWSIIISMKFSIITTQINLSNILTE